MFVQQSPHVFLTVVTKKWLSFRIKVQSSWIFIFQKINTWLGLKENMPDKFTSDINPTLNPNEL
jgi:hypothetical protein